MNCISRTNVETYPSRSHLTPSHLLHRNPLSRHVFLFHRNHWPEHSYHARRGQSLPSQIRDSERIHRSTYYNPLTAYCSALKYVQCLRKPQGPDTNHRLLPPNININNNNMFGE